MCFPVIFLSGGVAKNEPCKYIVSYKLFIQSMHKVMECVLWEGMTNIIKINSFYSGIY